MRDKAGQVVSLRGIVRDMTDRRRDERRLAAQHAAADALASARSTEQAAGRVAAVLATALGWPVAALWLVRPDATRLDLAAAHGGGPAHGGPAVSLTSGLGLPGQAWETAAPVWVEEGLARRAPTWRPA